MDSRIGRRAAAAVRELAAGPHIGPLLALVLGVSSLIEAFAYASPEDRPTAMLVNLLVTLPLVVAFRWRLWAAVAVTLLLMAPLSGVVVVTASAVAAELIVLFLVAERYGRLVSSPFAIPFLLNALFNFAGGDPGVSGLLLLVLVVASLALGDVWRLRGRAIAERDASRDAMDESVRLQAAMEERARIARELHDIVAHHVSVIAVQAETARLTTPGLSEEGRERFEAIAATARDSLTEMRRLLGVLREDAGGGAEREPQPGLERLNELVDAARESGAAVRLTLSGAVTPLPPGVDLSAYRIVQEALTNARRHAPGANVEIDLRYDPDALHLRVRDDGPGLTGAGDHGQGLLGMSERAHMVGGTLRSGPADDGGFVVEADLPIPEPIG